MFSNTSVPSRIISDYPEVDVISPKVGPEFHHSLSQPGDELLVVLFLPGPVGAL